MAVRSTYSSESALSSILTALSPLENLATEATLGEVKEKLENAGVELKKIRTGHEFFLWEQEVEEVD